MKEAIITRTIKSLEVVCLSVNMDTHEVGNITHVVPARLKEKSRVLAFLTGKYDAGNLGHDRPVEILEMKETQALYGMTESLFLKYAQPMKSRNNTEE